MQIQYRQCYTTYGKATRFPRHAMDRRRNQWKDMGSTSLRCKQVKRSQSFVASGKCNLSLKVGEVQYQLDKIKYRGIPLRELAAEDIAACSKSVQSKQFQLSWLWLAALIPHYNMYLFWMAEYGRVFEMAQRFLSQNLQWTRSPAGQKTSQLQTLWTCYFQEKNERTDSEPKWLTKSLLRDTWSISRE